MDSFVTDEELNILLTKAKAIDKSFVNEASIVETWANQFIDIWTNKQKNKEKKEKGEFTNGMYYPNKKYLRNPMKVKAWVNTLYKDVQSLKEKNPNITTHEIRNQMQNHHHQLKKYYNFIFNKIAIDVMKPSFYIEMINDMCDAQQQIIKGKNVDEVEAALEARFLFYKKRKQNE